MDAIAPGIRLSGNVHLEVDRARDAVAKLLSVTHQQNLVSQEDDLVDIVLTAPSLK